MVKNCENYWQNIYSAKNVFFKFFYPGRHFSFSQCSVFGKPTDRSLKGWITEVSEMLVSFLSNHPSIPRWDSISRPRYIAPVCLVEGEDNITRPARQGDACEFLAQSFSPFLAQDGWQVLRPSWIWATSSSPISWRKRTKRLGFCNVINPCTGWIKQRSIHSGIIFFVLKQSLKIREIIDIYG
jgi:hypothetical protein